MDWTRLMSRSQLHKGQGTLALDSRTGFQRDIDRIVFSTSFRKLQDKTQVHPLSKSDHVRTRLTHTIEVASVGRSLGTEVGMRIAPRLPKDAALQADDFGYVVQAACLAHDIGNPPFGHGGEEAIRSWYREKVDPAGFLLGGSPSAAEYDDLTHFDGNAQGFRIITNLEMKPGRGGLQMTHAALGAFMKYPRPSYPPREKGDSYIGGKKPGFFRSEEGYFRECAEALGLIPRSSGWCRHPLVYLMEAADDICYSIIDIEDGFETGYLPLAEAQDILQPLAKLRERSPEISIYRAKAIGNLVSAVVTAFMENEEEMLDGRLDKALTDLTPFNEAVRTAKREAIERVFRSEPVLWPETVGYEVLHGILDQFGDLVPALEKTGWDTAGLKGKLFNLSLLLGRRLDGAGNRYEAYLRLNDYVSGLTDGHALTLFRRLKGLQL
jgi:dGTPase